MRTPIDNTPQLLAEQLEELHGRPVALAQGVRAAGRIDTKQTTTEQALGQLYKQTAERMEGRLQIARAGLAVTAGLLQQSFPQLGNADALHIAKHMVSDLVQGSELMTQDLAMLEQAHAAQLLADDEHNNGPHRTEEARNRKRIMCGMQAESQAPVLAQQAALAVQHELDGDTLHLIARVLTELPEHVDNLLQGHATYSKIEREMRGKIAHTLASAWLSSTPLTERHLSPLRLADARAGSIAVTIKPV